LPEASGQQRLALLYQLQHSQWWPAARLRDYQFRQLQSLWRHCLETVPYYRDRYARELNWATGDLNAALWRQIPILRRAEVQANDTELVSLKVPQGHGAVLRNQSTGSTGRPVHFATTELSQQLLQSFQLRDLDWQGWQTWRKVAVITSRIGHVRYPGWGAGFDDLYVTGDSVCLDARNDIATQARWLAAQDPAYLICAVTNLLELARYCLAEEIRLPGLCHVRAVSEVLRPELKPLVREAWKARLSQAYSCEEAGLLAVDHPDIAGLYVQDENVYLEILNERGEPSQPGEIGEVVITQLGNFAMPLIRYALGDYARLGETPAAGRGLTVLDEVMGRRRNYLRMADGRRLWPNVPSGVWFSFPAIRRFQIVQHSLREIEVRLDTSRRLTLLEAEQLKNKLHERLLSADFEFRLSYPDTLERGPGGKFEDVISLIDDGPAH